MGLFDSDDDGSEAQDRSNQLANEQIQMNQAELERKRQNLYDERLDIIKGQGGQSWVPDRTSSSQKGSNNGNPLSGGYRIGPFNFPGQNQSNK